MSRNIEAYISLTQIFEFPQFIWLRETSQIGQVFRNDEAVYKVLIAILGYEDGDGTENVKKKQ